MSFTRSDSVLSGCCTLGTADEIQFEQRVGAGKLNDFLKQRTRQIIA
jgi:hypothetical protein